MLRQLQIGDCPQRRWLWLALLVVLFDQLSKQWIEAHFVLYQSLEILPFFRLTLVYNQGAAFSFLSDQGGWQRGFFILLALLITLFLLVWLLRMSQRERLAAIALALVIGGAVGNLIDRILFGHVIDFLHLHYHTWHWPVFNLADSAITVGVILLLYDGLLLEPRRSRETPH